MPTARIQGNLRSAVSKTTKTINQTLKMPNPKISKRCKKRMSNLTISCPLKSVYLIDYYAGIPVLGTAMWSVSIVGLAIMVGGIHL
jgi:hypothetical protein